MRSPVSVGGRMPSSPESCRHDSDRSPSPPSRSYSSSSSSASSSASSLPTVPSVEAYPGAYDFQISFEEQSKDTKSTTWTYSHLVKKLFVRMATTCPIRFRTATAPPAGTTIRATPIYMKPEHVQEVVRRCPNHATAKEWNERHPAPEHLVRAEHQLATYAEDHYTQRLSVAFPHEAPQVGAEWVTNLFQFMCFSSCVGGLNRRPIQLVFTLEHQGTILGRQAVEVRVCACPGRDRRGEETAACPEKSLAGGGVKRRSPAGVGVGLGPSLKRKRYSQNGDEYFTITVKGRDQYDMLCRMRDALELASLIPAQQIQVYKTHQADLQRQFFSADPAAAAAVHPNTTTITTIPATTHAFNPQHSVHDDKSQVWAAIHNVSRTAAHH